jgi:selenide,water dikinase
MNDLPIMAEALDMYEKGMSTGVNAYNRQLVNTHLRFDMNMPEWHQEIVFDPQTSGGLLVAVPEKQAQELIQKLQSAGVSDSKVIGNVSEIKESYYLIFK